MIRTCLIAFVTTLIVSTELKVTAFSSPKRFGHGRSTFYLLATPTATSDASRLKRVARLADWAKAADIKLGGVGIQSSDVGAGLGLLATQDLATNTVAVTVPSSIALSIESPGDGPDDRTVQDLFDDRSVLKNAPWFAQFAIYLHSLDKVSSSKRGRRGETDMRPWLDSLPRVFDTPLHWNNDERTELQYSHLKTAVARQETEWNKLYQTLLSGGSAALSQMSWNDFCWGCECARSRAFSGGYTGSAFNPLPYAFTLLLVTAYVGLNLGTLEQAANGAGLVLCASILNDFVLPKLFKKKRYVICPVIDMANHKSVGTSGDVSFEFFGDAYSLAVTNGSGVTKGSELYISYGARSNDQLLQFYGFVETDNPYDVYVMPPLRDWNIAALEQACGRVFSPGRLQKLDKAGLLGGTSVVSEDFEGAGNPEGGVVITRAGGIDPAVMQALRALVSSDEEWDAAGQAIGNFAADFSGGTENEKMARLAARTAIELELSSKPTTIEEDKELLKRMKASKSMDANPERTLAIAFRMEKKKLLSETINNLF